MKEQKEIAYQMDLFMEQKREAIPYSEGLKDVYGEQAGIGHQINQVGQQGRALATNLMGLICTGENFKRAHKQVKANKGCAGVDQMPVGDFAGWYIKEGEALIERLHSGSYLPQAVKRAKIRKPNGGERLLGIPTVTDRIIQQAISQVLSPLYERQFSEHSYGFREGRNAHQALRRASEYVADGYEIVVDLDLKDFFDEVNHDRLMNRLRQSIRDITLLRLIRKYLQSGILIDGVMSQRTAGTPQGSPLSPLLSNIVLDEMDKELEKRGHKFVRYADDCNIFVRTRRAGERVEQSISNFIQDKLKLKVNAEKSKVCYVNETKFLGYTIQRIGTLTIAEKSLDKLKDKVRETTRRNRGRSLEQVLAELNSILRGWLQYFRYANCYRVLRDIDSWIRRKLRCYRLKQCRRVKTVQAFLKSLGVDSWQSWILALSGKGWWRKANCPQVNQAMNNLWFSKQGLYCLTLNYDLLNNYLKPPCTKVCPVV